MGRIHFGWVVEEVREESAKAIWQLMRKFEEGAQRNDERMEKKLLGIENHMLNLEGATDKKVRARVRHRRGRPSFYPRS
jgi:ribosomal protein L22